jgi:hypothetical protein
VDTSPQTQLHPVISGDRVAWLDLAADEFQGQAASTQLGGSGTKLSADSNVWDVVFAGDVMLTLNARAQIVRTDPSGAGTVVAGVSDAFATLAAGLAGSDDGGAWLSQGDTVSYIDPAGTVTQADVPGLQGDTIVAIGVGGGTVAVGTDQGKVFLWTPGRGGFRQVGQAQGAVLSIATRGGNVFVIGDSGRSALITADGQHYDVTAHAAPFGAAMSEEYVVWAEALGPSQAGVVPGGQVPYPETDLYLLSLGTGKIYDLHPVPAQQGFPSLSGRQLVWQDATFGGDDVFTAAVPGGL